MARQATGAIIEHRGKDGRIYRKAESWATYPELGMLDVEAVPLPRWKEPIEVLAIVRRRDQHGS